VVSTVLWSLRTRYWAWRVAAHDPLPSPDIQIFAIYQRGHANRALPDSVGLTKGLYAIANLYADPERPVRTRSSLPTSCCTHWVRRTSTTWPPDGHECRTVSQNRERSPLFPQQYGEIMAGRIALSPTEAAMADDLDSMLVGPLTAHEIGWSAQ
jgi:hypothetical protein